MKTVNDFKIGDKVYHVTAPTIVMVIIEVNSDDLSCRWLDKNGTKHVEEFLPQELEKVSDRGFGFA